MTPSQRHEYQLLLQERRDLRRIAASTTLMAERIKAKVAMQAIDHRLCSLQAQALERMLAHDNAAEYV